MDAVRRPEDASRRDVFARCARRDLPRPDTILRFSVRPATPSVAYVFDRLCCANGSRRKYGLPLNAYAPTSTGECMTRVGGDSTMGFLRRAVEERAPRTVLVRHELGRLLERRARGLPVASIGRLLHHARRSSARLVERATFAPESPRAAGR